MLRLVGSCSAGEGVGMLIGSGSGHSVLSNCSVVGAPCQIKGEGVGVVGVIGTTRVAYEQVLPVVDVTAKLLS